MYSLIRADGGLDSSTALRLKKKLAEEFRQQRVAGVPTNEDEQGLRRLAAQIRAGKVIVKLFLRHSLHAKLYLRGREVELRVDSMMIRGMVKRGDYLDREVSDPQVSEALLDYLAASGRVSILSN